MPPQVPLSSATLVEARPRVFFGWYIVIATTLASLWTGGVFYYGFTAFFNPILNDYGWSRAVISLGFSLQSIESGFMGPLIGFLMDRFGIRRVVLPGVVVAGTGFLLLSQIRSLPTFYAALLVTTLGFSAGASAGGFIAVANWFERRRGRAIAILSTGFGLSGILAPVLVRLISHFGWRGTFIILGFATWALCLPLACILRHRPQPYGYLPDGDKEVPAATISGQDKHQEAAGLTVKQTLGTSAFWQLGLGAFFAFAATSAITVHLIPHLTSKGISRETAALAVSGMTLASITGRLGFGFMGDIWDKRWLMAGSFVLQALGILVLASIKQPWHLSLFLLTYGPGYAGSYPIRPAIQADYFGLKAYGAVSGLMFLGGTLGGMIGPLFAGWIFDVTQSYRLALLIFSVVSLFAIPVTLAMKPPRYPSHL